MQYLWDSIKWRVIATYYIGWWVIRGMTMIDQPVPTRWESLLLAWRSHRAYGMRKYALYRRLGSTEPGVPYDTFVAQWRKESQQAEQPPTGISQATVARFAKGQYYSTDQHTVLLPVAQQAARADELCTSLVHLPPTTIQRVLTAMREKSVRLSTAYPPLHTLCQERLDNLEAYGIDTTQSPAPYTVAWQFNTPGAPRWQDLRADGTWAAPHEGT